MFHNSSAGQQFLEEEGIKRVHAHIDFGQFAPGALYEHVVTTSGEKVSHPFKEEFQDLFISTDERIIFHTLSNLRRLSKESPSHRLGDDFDFQGWGYLLNIPETDFWSVFHYLEQVGAIKVHWIPSPSSSGTFEPTGYLELRSTGYDMLDELEMELVQRRREIIMPGLEEDAFQVARFLYNNRYIGARMIVVKELKAQVDLSHEEFDTADNFLLEARYCKGTMGGDAGVRYLTAGGVVFVRSKLSQRMDLSAGAEKLARYMYTQMTFGKPNVVMDQAIDDLRLSRERYAEFAEELVDENLAKELSVDTESYNVLTLTVAGRRAVRRNFRCESEIRAIVDGDYVQGDKVGGDKVVATDINHSNLAMGRDSKAVIGLTGDEISQLFSSVFEYINGQTRLPAEEKKEVVELVELVQDEVEKGDQANERAVARFLRDIAKMAPDILDVIISTATAFFSGNPALAAIGVLKKIAEKVKAEASKKG